MDKARLDWYRELAKDCAGDPADSSDLCRAGEALPKLLAEVDRLQEAHDMAVDDLHKSTIHAGRLQGLLDRAVGDMQLLDGYCSLCGHDWQNNGKDKDDEDCKTCTIGNDGFLWRGLKETAQ